MSGKVAQTIAMLLFVASSTSASSQNGSQDRTGIQLVTPGSEPRRVVTAMEPREISGYQVLELTLGLKELTLGLKMESARLSIPEIKIGQRITTEYSTRKSSEDNSWRGLGRVLSVELLNEADLPPSSAASWDEQNQKLIGLEYSVVLNTDGSVRTVQFNRVVPGLEDRVDAMLKALRNSRVTMPAGPIGAGATWEMESPIETTVKKKEVAKWAVSWEYPLH